MWAATFWPKAFWPGTFWPPGATEQPPVVTPAPARGALGIGRTLKRSNPRLVKRILETPDGPLEVLVPAEWTTDDLVQLALIIRLTDD